MARSDIFARPACATGKILGDTLAANRAIKLTQVSSFLSKHIPFEYTQSGFMIFAFKMVS